MMFLLLPLLVLLSLFLPVANAAQANAIQLSENARTVCKNQATKTILSSNSSRKISLVEYDLYQGNFHLAEVQCGKVEITNHSFENTSQAWIPLIGRWDGEHLGYALYDSATSTFHLYQSTDSSAPEFTVSYGLSGYGLLPISGDWNGDGKDSVGFYDPTNGAFYLKTTLANTSDNSKEALFHFGPQNPSLLPVIGDWNGDGTTTVGLYDPQTALFYLTNQNAQSPAEHIFKFGAGGFDFLPVSGDWNGDGQTSVGLYQYSSGNYYLTDQHRSNGRVVAFHFGETPSAMVPLGAR